MATRSTRLGLILALLPLLGACAGLDPYRTPPASGSNRPVPQVPSSPAATGETPSTPLPGEPNVVPPPPSAPKPGPAAAHLLAEAQQLSARRDFDRAAAQIERALRIERNNPWLYLALADVRLAQDDARQASILVGKARSLSQGDPQVLREAEALTLRNPQASGAP
ncbi:MAG: tetratricopeptide repeat protein [Gammaproteobacteria bacterium]